MAIEAPLPPGQVVVMWTERDRFLAIPCLGLARYDPETATWRALTDPGRGVTHEVLTRFYPRLLDFVMTGPPIGSPAWIQLLCTVPPWSTEEALPHVQLLHLPVAAEVEGLTGAALAQAIEARGRLGLPCVRCGKPSFAALVARTFIVQAIRPRWLDYCAGHYGDAVLEMYRS